MMICFCFLQKVSDELVDESSSSSCDSDDELNLLKFFERQKSSHNADEMVVTAAKEMGKELYAHLSPEERRDKLDAMVGWIYLNGASIYEILLSVFFPISTQGCMKSKGKQWEIR